MAWQPADKAPHDVPLIVKTERGRIFRAKIAWIDADMGWTWVTAEEDDPVPECWDDGVCWSENASGERSDWPVEFMLIPSPSEAKRGDEQGGGE